MTNDPRREKIKVMRKKRKGSEIKPGEILVHEVYSNLLYNFS
jgi:hypothetical protein